MAKPTLTPAPNDPPILGSPTFAADAQGFLGWFPVMGQYMQDMGDWIETMIGDVPSENIAAFAHLTGAANKLPYFTGAGAMAMADLTADGRSLLSKSGVLGLNSAGLPVGSAVAQSKYDTTTGRFMKVNDAGLMGRAINANEIAANMDLNDAPSGVNIAFGVGSKNTPRVDLGDGTGMAGFLYTYEWNTGVKIQSIVATYPSPLVGRVYRRYFDQTNWGPWIPEYSAANATTYQSVDGVQPIFQRGSNSNGAYTLFLDGRMECTRTLTLSTVAPSNLSAVWTFPYAFAGGISFLNASPNMNSVNNTEPGLGGVGQCGMSNVTNSACTVSIWRMTGCPDFVSGNTISVRCKAEGYWK
ncbi:hypothetical protein RPE78_09660 [Thioclava litoralis]|uniref:Tail fiber protein n=1 Tax=Thioclava litoralis TaxID=3076557 RepID=A0ABZ1DXU0_9RHOB|nr:hypothetical protein RPE78_09660 [Thioclava sp. FTW29]